MGTPRTGIPRLRPQGWDAKDRIPTMGPQRRGHEGWGPQGWDPKDGDPRGGNSKDGDTEVGDPSNGDPGTGMLLGGIFFPLFKGEKQVLGR